MNNIVHKFDVGLLKSALQINHSLDKFIKFQVDHLEQIKTRIKKAIMKTAKENTCTFPGMLSFGSVIDNKTCTNSDDD